MLDEVLKIESMTACSINNETALYNEWLLGVERLHWPPVFHSPPKKWLTYKNCKNKCTTLKDTISKYFSKYLVRCKHVSFTCISNFTNQVLNARTSLKS